MVVHDFQPGIGDLCRDPTGLLVKVEDIDIYNYVHFSVIEGDRRGKTKQGCQAVDLRRYRADSICSTCNQTWGGHVGLLCPDGKGEFVPGEQVTQEIDSEKVGENKIASGQMSCVAFLRRFIRICHATAYGKAA
jgi:hypothetical protein